MRKYVTDSFQLKYEDVPSKKLDKLRRLFRKKKQ